jgi:hypothetical protein
MIDKKYTKFEEECESNNGVVVMDGRGGNLCVKKTVVIQI